MGTPSDVSRTSTSTSLAPNDSTISSEGMLFSEAPQSSMVWQAPWCAETQNLPAISMSGFKKLKLTLSLSGPLPTPIVPSNGAGAPVAGGGHPLDNPPPPPPPPPRKRPPPQPPSAP